MESKDTKFELDYFSERPAIKKDNRLLTVKDVCLLLGASWRRRRRRRKKKLTSISPGPRRRKVGSGESDASDCSGQRLGLARLGQTHYLLEGELGPRLLFP